MWPLGDRPIASDPESSLELIGEADPQRLASDYDRRRDAIELTWCQCKSTSRSARFEGSAASSTAFTGTKRTSSTIYRAAKSPSTNAAIARSHRR